MNFAFLLLLALRSLTRNKLRSGLTMLGVIIGVASVVAMVAIGEGAKSSVQKTIASMGTNFFYVRPGSVSSGGVSWGAGSVNTLTTDDGQALAEECSLITGCTPIIYHRIQVVYGDKNWSPDTMIGVNEDYAQIKNCQAIEGGWFTPQDVRSGAKVCLIGTTIKREMFPFSSPLGKTLRVGTVPMTVIGVLKSRGTSVWGSDQDSAVIMPWTTMRQRLVRKKNKKNIDRLMVGVRRIADMEPAMEQARQLLRYRHKIRSGYGDDFRIYDLSEYMKSHTETSEVMSKLIAVIASISLLVGGIGIMNIMLVSVTERTREIGVRMAVGAKGKHILWQFLAESITLSCVGGLLGIALGEIARHCIIEFAGWPAMMSVDAMLIAFGVSLVIGVAFGFYPSWKASRLDPIDCLRYE